jgi:periplasmic protein TonB
LFWTGQSCKNLNPDPSPGRRREIRKTRLSASYPPSLPKRRGAGGLSSRVRKTTFYNSYKFTDCFGLVSHAETSTPTLLPEEKERFKNKSLCFLPPFSSQEKGGRGVEFPGSKGHFSGTILLLLMYIQQRLTFIYQEYIMAVIKNPKVNLRAKYQRFFEISLILSLTILITAFKYFPRIETHYVVSEQPPVIINVQDIQQTKQSFKRPPPPRPAIVIADPIDDDPVDIDLPPSDINTNDYIKVPPQRDDGKKIVKPEPFFDIAEEMPSPVGGLQAFLSKITYPEIARQLGIQGKVYVLAYVNETGDVVSAEVVKGVGAGLDEAALKAVMETKFIPGKQRGKAVKVKITIPVVFRLK